MSKEDAEREQGKKQWTGLTRPCSGGDLVDVGVGAAP